MGEYVFSAQSILVEAVEKWKLLSPQNLEINNWNSIALENLVMYGGIYMAFF